MKTLLKVLGLMVVMIVVASCEGIDVSELGGGGYDPSDFDEPFGFGSPFGFDDGFPAPLYGVGPGFGYYNGGFPGPGWGYPSWDDDDD